MRKEILAVYSNKLMQFWEVAMIAMGSEGAEKGGGEKRAKGVMTDSWELETLGYG